MQIVENCIKKCKKNVEFAKMKKNKILVLTNTISCAKLTYIS